MDRALSNVRLNASMVDMSGGFTPCRTAAPIFKQFMDRALKGRAKTPFHVPAGLVVKNIANGGYHYVIPGKKGIEDDAGPAKSGGGNLDGTGGTY